MSRYSEVYDEGARGRDGTAETGRGLTPKGRRRFAIPESFVVKDDNERYADAKGLEVADSNKRVEAKIAEMTAKYGEGYELLWQPGADAWYD